MNSSLGWKNLFPKRKTVKQLAMQESEYEDLLANDLPGFSGDIKESIKVNSFNN